MSHGLNSIPEVVISIISEMLIGEQLALEFDVLDQRVLLHVVFVF